MPASRAAWSAVALTFAALVAAGCSQAEGQQTGGSATPTAKAQTLSPLTGLPVSAAAQPVVVVKIDNTESARPQLGVRAAELVIEEPVEGGLTRLAAFYEHARPRRVGPVRSARISDIALVKPVRATVVASGAAQQTLAAFERADVTLVDETHHAFTRDTGRSEPNDRFVDLTELGKAVAHTAPEQPYFEFGATGLPSGVKARAVSVRYSHSATERWNWQPSRRVWEQADPGGTAFPATTVVLLKVGLQDAGYRDAAGSWVPIVESTGRGDGYLLADGQVHEVHWSKQSPQDSFKITTKAGRQILIPPGRTWVGLLPKRTSDVSFS